MAGKPVQVAYYYKIKWGFHDEFIELFKKNHYPVLKAQLETGRILDIKMYTPKYHGDGRADWNFLSVLVFRDWEVMGTSSGELEIAKKLFPDQETYQREERRRFELVEAHWDVPLKEIVMQ